MSSVLGIENSTFRVRPFCNRVLQIPCRCWMLVRCDSEATVTEKSSAQEIMRPLGILR